MDQRREARFPTNTPVKVTALGEDPAGRLDRVMPGVVEDCSIRGMRVSVPEAVQAGSAIRLELDSQILLAEVCYCQPAPNGVYLGLEIEQTLAHVDDLNRLVKALIGDAPSRQPAPQPSV